MGGAPAPAGPPEQGGGFLVPVGYVFSLLGGLLGIAIGGALWQSKEKGPGGEKHPKYKAATRRHGIAMIVLGGVMFGVSTQLSDQIGSLLGGGGPTDPPTVTTGGESGGAAGGAQPGTPPGGGAQPSRPSGGGAQPSRPAGGASGGGSLASLGLTPNAAPADEYEELVLNYLKTAYEVNLQDEGFGAAIHRQFGSLNQDRSEDVNFRLPANSDIAIFGVCDNECSDLNFMLFSEDGRLVDQDQLDDDVPLVVVETGEVERYTVRVEMVTCTVGPCYYALGVYRR